MNRKEKKFHSRNLAEQKMFSEDTWCDFCNEADLGLNKPIEYELGEKIFIEGVCKKCGYRVVSEIIE
jgi:hypothetical protein